MNEYIVAIDTGGSKTQMLLSDFSLNILSSSRTIGVGGKPLSEVKEHLEAGVNDLLCDKFKNSDVKYVITNIGGANTDDIKNVLTKLFPNAITEAHRESSGVIMSAFCEMESIDVLLMAGTGSICFSKGKNGNIITDGWCPNIGDNGSGYWIGLEAIKRSVLALEDSKPLSPLTKEITKRDIPFEAFEDTTLQMNIRDEVRSNFMPLNRADVASITQLATKYAENGDEFSKRIFIDAGYELAKTVIRGIRIANCNKPARILVSGGLVKCFDLWKESFNDELKSEDKNILWQIGDADMCKAALYYIMNKYINNIKER